MVTGALSCQQYTLSVMDEKMSMENLRNDTDRGKQKYSGKKKPFASKRCTLV